MADTTSLSLITKVMFRRDPACDTRRSGIFSSAVTARAKSVESDLRFSPTMQMMAMSGFVLTSAKLRRLLMMSSSRRVESTVTETLTSDVVTTSEVSVSVTVDSTRRLDDIISNLRNFAEVSTKPDMAIVCIVGENLRSDSTLFARAVTALEKIPLRLVSQAGSRRNITFVMSDSDVVSAMNLLHDQFFGANVGVS